MQIYGQFSARCSQSRVETPNAGKFDQNLGFQRSQIYQTVIYAHRVQCKLYGLQ